jgi:NADPH:quinone reductase-like Zn-dependent oxidoreductase
VIRPEICNWRAPLRLLFDVSGTRNDGLATYLRLRLVKDYAFAAIRYWRSRAIRRSWQRRRSMSTIGWADGRFQPKIAGTFPFMQTVEAYKYLESNAQVGKAVITVP